jgi:starch-binding outer membrane protein, SusD/RagB family
MWISHTSNDRGRGHWLRPLGAGIAAAALGLSAACDVDRLVQVEDPFIVTLPVAQDPAHLDNVHAGVFNNFLRAYGGRQNRDGGIILYSGMMADELFHSGTFGTRREIDERRIVETNAQNDTVYTWLHRARDLGEQSAALFAGSPRAGTAQHAELLNIAGFSTVLIGETFCSGVPFSSVPTVGDIQFGSPLTTQQIFARSIERFNEALQIATTAGQATGQRQANLARIGLGRAHLNNGDFQAAASAVADVPTGYVYNIPFDASALWTHNAVFQLLNGERRWSVASNKGTNGLPYVDPRTPWTGPFNNSFSGQVPHYPQQKYGGLGTDIPLATGIEARLIEAEAALRAGQIGTFITKHDEARAAAGLGALDVGAVNAMNERQRVDLHFRERAYHMWLTAHRLGDLRRLVRQYQRPVNEVYPIGLSMNGQPYGNQVTLRVPFRERNNPEYAPDACDPTRP